MTTRLTIIIAGLFIAIATAACGDTNGIDESDAAPIEIDSRADQTETDEAKPGLEANGGFWGDGYHEEEETEEAP